jgi:hypothetical protein
MISWLEILDWSIESLLSWGGWTEMSEVIASTIPYSPGLS